MRRLILAATAIAALAVPSLAAAAPVSGNTSCTDNSLAWKTIGTNVTVPAGATCDLSGADVKGNVSVAGTLVNFGRTTYEKNVSVVGGSFIANNWGVTINGNMSFLNPAANSTSGFWPPTSDPSRQLSEVKGNLSFTIDGTVAYPCYQWPGLYAPGGRVDGNFNYTGYTIPGHLTAPVVLGGTSITTVDPQGC